MRGQAAVEYLVTYGWAIFALLFVLAILLTSGIISPNYLISEECSFGTNFQCQFALVDTGSSTDLEIQLFNGFPYDVRITGLDIVSGDGGQYFIGFADEITDEPLPSGESRVFTGTLTGGTLREGTIKRFNGNISYVSCAPELGGCTGSEHTVTGRVVGRVIAP